MKKIGFMALISGIIALIAYIHKSMSKRYIVRTIPAR